MTRDPAPEALRRRVLARLGHQVGRIGIASVETRASTRASGARIDDLCFTTTDGARIPAYAARPLRLDQPAPALLYCHAHGNRYDIGREELLHGRRALQRAYLADLVAGGFVVLCMEMPCFGARAEPAESPAAKAALWHGTPLFGQMLAELRAGLDYLAEDAAVDPSRIGTLGISMGGTHAWWLSALDGRVAAAVSLCCFADLGCLTETGAHDGHGQYMTVPGLLRECTTGELAGLGAPRAQLHCVGLQDWSTPSRCFERARNDVEDRYARAGALGQLSFCVDSDSGHEETPAMRARVLSFLEDHLAGRSDSA